MQIAKPFQRPARLGFQVLSQRLARLQTNLQRTDDLGFVPSRNTAGCLRVQANQQPMEVLPAAHLRDGLEPRAPVLRPRRALKQPLGERAKV